MRGFQVGEHGGLDRARARRRGAVVAYQSGRRVAAPGGDAVCHPSMLRWLPLLCALGCAAGCEPSLGPPRKQPLPTPDPMPALRTPEPRSSRIASYRIDASYDARTHRIEATEVLTWRNDGKSPVTEVPFHLYMNGFKNETSLFMTSSRGSHRGNSASDTAWGWIEVPSIRLGAQELRPGARYLGPDETVLEVPLPAPVAPGATLELTLAFTVQLPEVFARTGYQGAFTMVGQWFPKIGVRVGAPGFETWHCRPFHVHTEFFADFGVYDVALTVPDTHVVAATGVLTGAEDKPDGTRVLRYHAEDVHDFVWMIDPYMEVLTGEAKVEGGPPVVVRVVHRPRQRGFARRHLRAAIGAVEHFSQLFYPYPWAIMTVVDPPPEAGGAAGMEYPTLVTTAADHAFMREGLRFPEFVTIHEVGHNWFQGILASNEFEEAWLDEGVNEWADGVVMARIYGEKGSAVDWMGWTAEQFRMRRALGGSLADLPAPIATAAYVFPDAGSYGAATYTKTMLALRTLENLVGRDRFGQAMKAYAQAWAFKHPTGNDLVTSLEQHLGEDLDWFWRPAFYQTGAADFAVRSADCHLQHPARGVFGEGESRRTRTGGETPSTGTWTCQIVIVNTGTIAVPVDIELRFADGTRTRERWDARDGSRWHELTVSRSKPLAEVVIDPDGLVLISDRVADDHLRLVDDNRAAWRASARLTFWTHTAMQAVGL